MKPIDLIARPTPKSLLDYWREHRIDAVVYPHGWLQIPETHVLAWQCARFNEANHAEMPLDRGIYAFSVSIRSAMIPPNGYIAYVGVTGAKEPRTLQERYGDYLRERRVGSKRPRIRRMFELWGEHLDFWYASCADLSIDLEGLERDVNSALVTPFVEKDFHDEIRPLVKLLRDT